MSCANELYASPLAARSAIAPAHWPRRIALACIDLWRWRRDCQALLALDDRLLADVGVTREEAERQASHWLAGWLRQRSDGGAPS